MSDIRKTRKELMEELALMRQHIIASEEKYRILVDNTTIPITYITVDGYILLINLIGARNLGGSPKEFVGRNIHDILPEMAEINKYRFRLIMETGNGGQYEDLIQLPGSERWFLSNLEPVKDIDSNVFAIQIVSHDYTEQRKIEEELHKYHVQLEDMVLERTDNLQKQIDERRKVERALKESEERFISVLESSPDYIVEFDRDFTILYVNHPAPGHTVEDSLGTNIIDYILPEDRDRFIRAINITFKTAMPDIIEVNVRFPDAQIYSLEIRFGPITRSGQIKTLVMIARDITDRKKIDEEIKRGAEILKRTESIAKVGGWEIDLISREITWTEGNRQLLGYDKEYHPKLEDAFKMCHPDDLPLLLKATNRILEYGGSFDLEARVFTRMNEELWVRLIGGVEWENEKPLRIHGTSQDISSRINAERTIRSSEERFRSIFENVSDTIVYCDMTGRIINANRKIVDISGYQTKEVIGKSFIELGLLTHASLEKVFRTLTNTVMKGAPPTSIQIDINKRDGDTIVAETSPSLLRMADGTEGILVIIRDITARKQAEDALIDSERRYRLLADNVLDIIWTLDMDLRYTYISPSVTWIQGYTVQEAMERTVEDLLSAESMTIVTEIFHEELALEKENYVDHSRSRTVELEVYCKDGAIIWMESTMTFLRDDNGIPIGIIGVSRDVTKRKQAEESLLRSENKYKTLTNNLNVGVYRNTPGNTGRFIEANPAHYQMFGYDSKEEFMAVNVSDLYRYPEDRQHVSDDLSANGFIEDRLLELKKKDGTYFVGSLSAVAIKDEEGHVVFFDGIIEDITRRQQAEQQILRRNRELAALNAIAQSVLHSPDIKGILKVTLDNIYKLVDMNRLFISLLDERGCYVLRAHKGFPAKHLKKFSRWKPENEFLNSAISSGTPLYVDSNDMLREIFGDQIAEVIIEDGFGSLMYIPLKTKGNNLGLLTVITDSGYRFSSDEQDLLVTIGHQISTVVENALLHEELRREGEIRREGLRQAILSQEEERRRIARGLHDQTSQVLTGASAMIEASIASLPRGFETTKETLRHVRSSLTNMQVDVRNIIYELRPTMLDDLGFVAAARWQADEFLGRAGVKAHFRTKGRSKKLSAQVETALFRIIQEATTNIVKHAKAKSARINFVFGKEQVFLTVEDDGIGLDLQQDLLANNGWRGLGFLSMKERAEILGGTCIIDSNPGYGTRISVELPI